MKRTKKRRQRRAAQSKSKRTKSTSRSRQPSPSEDFVRDDAGQIITWLYPKLWSPQRRARARDLKEKLAALAAPILVLGEDENWPEETLQEIFGWFSNLSENQKEDLHGIVKQRDDENLDLILYEMEDMEAATGIEDAKLRSVYRLLDRKLV